MAGIQTSIQLVDRITNPLRNITNALNHTISAFEQAQREGQAFDNVDFTAIRSEINSANAELVALSENTDRLNNANTSRLNNGMSSLGDNIRNANTQQETFNRTGIQVGGITKKVIALAGAYASFQGIKKVINISDNISGTMARLSNLAKNETIEKNVKVNVEDRTNELFNQIYASAQRSRGSVSDMADIVARFGNNAKDAFSSNDEILRFSEILQKSMSLAGTTGAEASATMLQLSQALGSGVLRGDELNSIFEASPNLIQYIADYMNVPIGQIRNLASEGKLSADIVKNAIMSAGDSVDEQFKNMPLTFGQAMQKIQNSALMMFKPVTDKISRLVNSNQFDAMVEKTTAAMSVLANVTSSTFDLLVNGASFVSDNWGTIAPIITGIATAFIAYNSALMVYNAVTAIGNGLKIASAILSVAKGTATVAEAAATSGATTAQIAFNSALLACPITWIVLAIIALITVLILVANHIAKTGKVATTTFGVITGGINVVIAFFKNLGLSVANISLAIGNTIGALAKNIVTAFGNAIKNVKAFWYDMLSSAISVVDSICQALNKLPFIDFDYSGITNMANDYANKAQAERNSKGEYANISDAFNSGLNTFDAYQKGWASDAYKVGASWGDGISNKISSKLKGLKNKVSFSQDGSSLAGASNLANANNSANDIANNTKKTANNTAKTADSLAVTSENLKYIRDYASQKAINRYTNSNITIDFKNNNTINNKSDVDGIVKKLSNDLLEALQSGAEGVM